jgi:hypothetical protein
MNTSSKRIPSIIRIVRNVTLALGLAAAVGGAASGPASAHEWGGYGRYDQPRAERFQHQSRYGRDARFAGRSFHRDGYGHQRDEHRFYRGW